MGKREGVDGSLNKSKTCKRRSRKVLSTRKRAAYVPQTTHGSPTSRGHPGLRRLNQPVGRCFACGAMTLNDGVNVTQGDPMGGLTT